MPEEVVKRLTPKAEVLRELYLKSGNVCAFPNCLHPIIDVNGLYVAQLCHIEAANEGGQRFNSEQTNEDRRQFENLLLMCHRHHKETDDVKKYPPKAMRKIKKVHEAKFEKVLDSLAEDVFDVALAYEPTKPNDLQSLVDAGLIEADEIEVYSEELNELINALHKLSPVSRKIFLLVLNRADENNLAFSFSEFMHVVSMDPTKAFEHIVILERYGLLSDNEDQNMFERQINISVLTSFCPYPISMVIKDFCEKNTIDLFSLIVDLNFSLLSNTEQPEKLKNV